MKAKTLQFGLWYNCNNACEFCFLKGFPKFTEDEQLNNITKVKTIINSNEMNDYNAIGLIGGEFFQGQLTKRLKPEFHDLIKNICKLYSENKIQEIWLTASLIHANQDDLYEVLDMIPKQYRVLICTSYDCAGRFKSEKQLNSWYSNIEKLALNYSSFILHTQIIFTQLCIENILQNADFLRKINLHSWIDFKTPAIFTKDYYAIKNMSIKSYRNVLHASVDKFPENFFVERSSLIKCLPILVDVFDVEKLNAMASLEARSDRCYSGVNLTDVLNDRWTKDNNIENAPCGHPWNSYCYVDSDKCALCDIINFYKELN